MVSRVSLSHQRRNASSSKPRFSKHNPYLSSHGHSGAIPEPSSPSSTYAPSRPKRLVVGVTGATGTVFAIRLLEILRELGVETHVVMSKWALATGKYETPMLDADVRQLATHSYSPRDLSAPIASGSFVHDGMLVVPCSMKTLAAVRTGYCDDLISRAADVCLKEDRRLLLAVRETPLSDVHLDNMLHLRRAGAVIFPPVPAFYTRPKSLDDIITQSVGRMLDSFGIHTDGFERWDGFDWKSKQMS
ncbi:uncharacterized protein E0L32_010240 [Thyridium curvatum]|uniref:Flavin prenyltransferase PAD1, mitochondrial n=1 Tax=Thyridium curvatum TaxID=1093900 RepID=A0A507AUY4_9PEZI|nr:uncharacterized protein E0L32_010240 [Thyridium curvatum]TPX08040.1 hypothetical protein E0L32_010240 [Thyridium curvatum]